MFGDKSDRGEETEIIFKNILQIDCVVLVQHRNSALNRPETIAVFEKQRLNSDFKTALCLYADQIFHSVLNGINLSKATEL